jgi:hypothetical protein
MSTRRKRASRRPAATHANSTVASDSASASAIPPATTSVNAENILDECVGAICLVEVTLHSLESQEVASPEQEVLRRALKSIWSVHDWIYELKPDDMDGEGVDREDES